MRSILLTVLLLVYSAGFGQDKSKIAVMDLKAKEGISQATVSSLTNLLCTAISDIGDYEVIGREDMQAMLEHVADKQLLECDDTKCLVEIGGALGVSRLVAGDIGMVGSTYLINLKFIDIDNANVLNRIAEQYKGTEDGLITSIQSAGHKLIGGKTPTDTPAGESINELNEASIIGIWTLPENKAKVEIYKQDNKYYGKYTWFKTPPDKKHNVKIGSVILKDFIYDGDNKWTKGRVIHPRNKKGFKGRLRLVNNNQLEVKARVIRLIAEHTEVWTR